MHKKAFRYIFIASAAAVFITGIISFLVMRSSAIEETKYSAHAMAQLIRNDMKNWEGDYDTKVKALRTDPSEYGYSSYRITIIGEDGTVLGDSDADIITMDDHSARPEVQEAAENGTGSVQRYSDTLKISMLYVAVKDDDTNSFVRVALPLTELRRTTYNLLIGVLISIMAGIVISVIISFIFSERLAKPINSLAMASYEFAGGNMNKRVELKTNTELDKLAEAFNLMAGMLENSLSQLKRKNEEFDAVLSSIEDGLIAVDMEGSVLYINHVAQKIFMPGTKALSENGKLIDFVYQDEVLEGVKKCLNENKSQKRQVKLGEDRMSDYSVYVYPMYFRGSQSGAIILFSDITNLLRLERMRSDFVANVSHELRTPLTSIKGYAETLRDEGIKDIENAKRFLNIIEIEADRLNILINDLMELSDIENKKEDVNISSHNFGEILDETIELVSVGAKKKGVTIKVDVPDDIKIWANRDRIKQLLLNLIDNGIKYNKDGGSVSVKAGEEGKTLKLVVKDTGVGIGENDIPRLFERFYRADKSRSKHSGGTGLGLSIVKHISELYNGSVTVNSKLGKGSEFTVTMPIVNTSK